MAASSGCVERAAYAVKEIDWRALAETAGVEAMASLLDPYVIVFNRKPTVADLLALQKIGNDLPLGYERRVVGLVERQRILTRRDYATVAAYDRAIAKGNDVKVWWEVTVAAGLEEWFLPNYLFLDIAASAKSATNEPSPLVSVR